MCNKIEKKIKMQGFTLVELSIVIIIIGLLIAGIAAGTSLINQASINGVIRDLQSYQASYNNFLGRYNAIPGDFANAANYWSNCTTGTAPDTACNGNGDSLIKYSTSTVGTNAAGDETVRAWRHLALANMISGAGGNPLVSGTSGGNLIIGTDLPASKVAAAGYNMVGPFTDIGGGATKQIASPWNTPVNDNRTNAVFIGKKTTGAGIANAALKPQDAFNIDKKIDDGILSGSTFSGANTGYFRSVDGADITSATAGFECLTAANANTYDGTTVAAACVSGLALN